MGELATAVYDNTRDVLLTLHQNGVMPDFVQISNETKGLPGVDLIWV